jgi:hypothetical protein
MIDTVILCYSESELDGTVAVGDNSNVSVK